MAKGIKTGGRQKGTPNSLTFQTRQLLVNVIADELGQLPDILSKLEPAQRVDALCKLCKFALPPMGITSPILAERRSLENPEHTLEAANTSNNMDRLLNV